MRRRAAALFLLSLISASLSLDAGRAQAGALADNDGFVRSFSSDEVLSRTVVHDAATADADDASATPTAALPARPLDAYEYVAPSGRFDQFATPARSTAARASSTAIDTNFAGTSDPFASPSDGALAVGPNHILQGVNSRIAAFSKTGAKLMDLRTTAFFGLSSVAFVSDPRVLYDSYSDRWFLVVVGNESGVRGGSAAFYAYSNTADPAGGYCTWKSDIATDASGAQMEGDFPAAGMDDYGFYLTFVRFFAGTQLASDTLIRLMPRSQLAACATVSPVSWTGINRFPDGIPARVLQPTIMTRATGVESFVVSEAGGGTSLGILRITNARASAVLSPMQVVSVNPYSRPQSAMQKGSSATLSMGDARLSAATAYRDGSLYTAHAALSSISAGSTVRWYQLDAVTGVVIRQGGIALAGSDGYAYPAVAVDSAGALGIAMTLAGPSYYASTVIATLAPAEANFDVQYLAAGIAPFADVSSPSRWGDYMGIAIDPDGRRFWAEGSYATSSSTWGTRVGAFTSTGAQAGAPTPSPTPRGSVTPAPAPALPPGSGTARSSLLIASDIGTTFTQTREVQDTIEQQAGGVLNPTPYATGIELLRAWGFVDSWRRDFSSTTGQGIYAVTSQATLYSTTQGALGDYGLNIDGVGRSGLGFRAAFIGGTVGTQSTSYIRDFSTPDTSGRQVPVSELFVMFWSGTASQTVDLYSFAGQMDLSAALRLARLQAGRTAGIATPTPVPTAPPSATPPPTACSGSVGPGIPGPQALATGIGGWHAAWYGQSGYPTLCPGQQSTATVAFLNTGTSGWVLGRAGQTAFLGTWEPEPGQDQPSPLGGDGTHGSPYTGWPVFNRVAVQPADYVGPGQVAWFQFRIQAPVTPGTYRLALRALIEGTQWLEDYGVFWYVTVLNPTTVNPSPTPTPPVTTVLTISPQSATIPVGGTQQFVTSGGTPGVAVSWSVTGGCGAITSNGLFAATASNSPTQPCYVIVSSGGRSAAASVTVR